VVLPAAGQATTSVVPRAAQSTGASSSARGGVDQITATGANQEAPVDRRSPSKSTITR
jgi:hypothetical protein